MRMKSSYLLMGVVLSCGICSVAPVLAIDVRVTIENLSGPTGIAFSPLIASAHDGSVDPFDSGSAASAGVQNVAELGSVGAMLINEIKAAQPSAVATPLANPDGTFGPLLPGAKQSVVLSLDPVNNRYFSYLAMAVPSNDMFIGNDAPLSHPLFDAAGNFIGQNFTLTGSGIWDAGTEVNGLQGAAFIVGQSATDHTAENGIIHPADLAAGFGLYVGQQTPVGYLFSGGPSAATPSSAISFSVVPEPTTLALAGLGLVGLIGIGCQRQLRRSSF